MWKKIIEKKRLVLSSTSAWQSAAWCSAAWQSVK